MEQSGKTLSMQNDAIWKGGFTNNGTLLKIHENAYTIGYSALLSPDGNSQGKVKFGNGVFLDAHQKNNKVYVGKPTVADAEPVFGGIVVREPAIASGYPVHNDKVSSFQKGLLCREGYVVYKEGLMTGHTSNAVNLYDTGVTYGYNLFVKDTDGTAFFSKKATETGYTLAGKVIEINPDDKSVTVKVTA